MKITYNYDVHTIADIPVFGAAMYKGRPALSSVASVPISYSELELYSRQAAARLSRLGIRKGDRVIILSENRPEWGIASFAIARAGAVAVPLLTDFPSEQMHTIIEHSGAKAAFVSEKFAPKLPQNFSLIIPIEELCDINVELNCRDVELPAVYPNDLAAIVYTSGTTGSSKGVMLTHKNYISDAMVCSVIIILNTKDIALSILPLAHAYEYTIGFLIPMMSGASVSYIGKAPSASVLKPALKAVRPSIVLAVPLVIEKMYKQAILPALTKMSLWKYTRLRPMLERLAGKKMYALFGGRLRFFGIGGAPLDPETERFLRAARWPYAIGYGLTETAPIIAASGVGKTKHRGVGTALPCVTIRLADMRPSDDDPNIMVGELQVRGPMVTQGYYKDKERSAEAFTDDGYFKTGDLGYADGDAHVFIRGRSKDLILGASGENIYPEEIEAVLVRSPYVEEAVVYGGEEGLTALIHLKPQAIADAAAKVKTSVDHVERIIADMLEAIRKDTNRKLAAFSRITKAVHHPDNFEKTPTHKIKRFLYTKKSIENPKGV